MDYYNVNTIEPDQRDSFGQYMIQPNTVTIFPFSIPLLQGLKLSAVHIYPNSQDFSIDRHSLGLDFLASIGVSF